jgi:hypothetical protein
MSRHKIVKNLDLHDELDDFDGGDDFDDSYEGAEEAAAGGAEGVLFIFLAYSIRLAQLNGRLAAYSSRF